MSKNQQTLALYVGPLTPEKLADGINAAKRNAKPLAEDAEILLKAQRFPSAFALATLSIEESGKAGILKSLGMAEGEKEVRGLWKEYRSHKSKNALWATFDYIHRGARKLEEFAPMFDPKQDHAQLLEQLKQLSLYTDCVEKGKWVEPTTMINEDLVRSIVQIANSLGHEHFVTAQELRIYFKHLGPVRKRNPAWIKQAFINFYAELQERGLKPPGANVAEDFVHGRIGPARKK